MVQPANASSNPIVYGLIENVPFSRYSIAVCHNHLAFLGGQIGYLDRITDLFFSAVQWIKEHLLCCFFAPATEVLNYTEIVQDLCQILNSPSPDEDSAISLEYNRIQDRMLPLIARILKPRREDLIQSLEIEMEKLRNLPSIPELSEAERAEVYVSPSPHAGRRKGQVWDENKEAWNQHVRRVFLDLPGYNRLKNSGYTITQQELMDCVEHQSFTNEIQTFSRNHDSDPQEEWVELKAKTLGIHMGLITLTN